jgi:hypothetical protein
MSESHKKRFRIDPSVEGYGLRSKIKPFLAGLLEGSPLVEVAIEGLRRGVSGGRRRDYELRIARHGSTEQIHAALLCGCGIGIQELMAEAFQARYNITLAEYSKKVESSESGMNGHNLVRAGAEYVKATMEQAARLLRSGTVDSDKAQTDFAAMIFADGTEEQAKDVLASGKITSHFAGHILRFKAHRNPGFDA